MANSKIIIGYLVFVFIFYTFVGYATHDMRLDNFRVDIDAEAMRQITDINASQLGEDTSAWSVVTGSGEGVSTMSIIWDMFTMRVFGLPAFIGFMFNFLIIGMLGVFATIEILNYVRGV